MNLHIINVIIKREYLNRVKKKSFLVTTFLGPILFAALCILPTVIMTATKEQKQTIAVVDESGIVLPYLENSETVTFVTFPEETVDVLKTNMKEMELDAVIAISAIDPKTNSLSAESFSEKPLGLDMTDNINSKINDAVEAYRIASYNIENLESIMKDVHSNIKMKTYTFDDEGKESISESGVYMLVSMLLGMLIYLFITLFSSSVMSSVIEEKASRVVEVLVSSVKATELMFGKIIGIALVALTQFLLWIVLTLAIVGVAGSFMGKDMLSSLASDPSVTAGVDAEMLAGISADAALETAAETDTAGVILSTLANLPLAEILICFVFFFFFGYLLYASLFAAIGSAVESQEDSQQLQIPLTIPLMLGFFIALYAFKSPDSQLVFWASMFPFTSPIVMLARLPFSVPVWQLVLSIGLLILTFIGSAWVSAKIYKVGILMFGKKSTFKDLWKWLKQ